MRNQRHPLLASSDAPPRVELIVKLGGSALTQKQQHATLHSSRFAACIRLMHMLYHARIAFIVVHGAGSFGHMEAAQHQVSDGAATALGMAHTHAAVRTLNSHVVNALLQHGVPAVGVSPLLVPFKWRHEFVATLLDRGHVPVLHGDVAYGALDGRTAILSGDTLVAHLCEAFHSVRRVVFLCDVRGLFTQWPDGDLINSVLVDECAQVTVPSSQSINTSPTLNDQTGGMQAKLMAAARCVAAARGRVTAFIAGAQHHGAKQALLWAPPRGATSDCTRICFDASATTPSKPTELPHGDTELLHQPRRRRWRGARHSR